MRGMTRSVITIAGRNVVTFSSASSPSLADSATKPQLLTSCSRPSRAAGSSSTIRTRSATVLVSPASTATSPAAVMVTQHLNHVIFTFWSPSPADASSTFIIIVRPSRQRGEPFARASLRRRSTHATRHRLHFALAIGVSASSAVPQARRTPGPRSTPPRSLRASQRVLRHRPRPAPGIAARSGTSAAAARPRRIAAVVSEMTLPAGTRLHGRARHRRRIRHQPR